VALKEIPGFSAYQASDDGQIRRCKPDNYGRIKHVGRVIKYKITPTGYCQISVTPDEGKGIMGYVHVLVAAAFIGPRPRGQDIHHKDGDKTNNAPGNLEYINKSQHAFHHNRGRKLSKIEVLKILSLRAAGWFLKDIAQISKVGSSAICRICTGETYSNYHKEFSDGR